jgi:chromosome segregation ATPase
MEIKTLKSRIQRLEGELRENQNSIASLTTDKSHLQQKLDELRVERAELSARNEKLESDVKLTSTKASAQKQSADAEIQRLQEQYRQKLDKMTESHQQECQFLDKTHQKAMNDMKEQTECMLKKLAHSQSEGLEQLRATFKQGASSGGSVLNEIMRSMKPDGSVNIEEVD